MATTYLDEAIYAFGRLVREIPSFGDPGRPQRNHINSMLNATSQAQSRILLLEQENAELKRRIKELEG